ncbi:MAG TPA: hypothetical protein VK186_06390 [Candidatus Deferrimicrobium sp.]|nr:hypothetical protein [Candidatus Deferrimicrobium sp.]
MKKLIILLILALLFFFFNCKNSDEIVLEENSEPFNVKLVFAKKIEVPDLAYPSVYKTGKEIFIRGFSTEKDKKIIINIYDEDLGLSAQKEFNMGMGPGDLGDGCYVYKFADHIYIPDNTQMRVNIFDKDFNFIKFVSLINPRFLPITFIKNGEYFLGTCLNMTVPYQSIYQSYIVKFPGLTKKQFHTLGPINTWTSNAVSKSKKLIIGEVPQFHYFYNNEMIYFIKPDDYQLYMYDLEGKLLKKVRVNVEKKKVPEDQKIAWLKEQVSADILNRTILTDYIQPAAWMIPMAKGFAVLRRKGYSRECNGLVEADYFDYQLNLKGKIEIPCFYRIFELRSGYFTRTFQYHDGYLYLITEMDETLYLEKWKVFE